MLKTRIQSKAGGAKSILLECHLNQKQRVLETREQSKTKKKEYHDSSNQSKQKITMTQTRIQSKPK